MSAGLTSTQEQVSIPAQHLLELLAVQIVAPLLTKNGEARVSSLRRTLSSGFGNLVGHREGA
ncbi:hypothetical protein [Sinorhizobium psoraleae]|uniref:Uncharacterized protein n=1 Tax=Sinorhizobium psoraleae TaxID=520838 RepID=A0ABT4KN85_9HYPH|nr:hypothetical protein [Sinorhizobium psoraleae]MCZ4093440.1 hypothetical protein [Sinorhizobium psoraleae]